MTQPVKFALAAAAAILGVAFALPLLHMGFGRAPPAAEADLPWAAAPQPDGSVRAIGLHIGGETLADVASRFGAELQVAVVARLGESGALEALIDPHRAGFVGGRLVLAFAADGQAVRGWRERALHSEAMEGGARRFALSPADRVQADRARLVGASFVPTIRLTVDDVERRFGPPVERRELGGGVWVLVYPGIGLTATVDGHQRSVLEFAAGGPGMRVPASR